MKQLLNNNELKEKIENILVKVANQETQKDGVSTSYEFMFGKYKDSEHEKLRDELITLFTEMVEGELRCFVDGLLPFEDEDGETITGEDVGDYIFVSALKEALKQYLLERKS